MIEIDEEVMVLAMEKREIFDRLREVEEDIEELIFRERYYHDEIKAEELEKIQHRLSRILQRHGD